MPSYWLADPDARTLTVLELEDGVYCEIASVAGTTPFTALRPFPVRIVPENLSRS